MNNKTSLMIMAGLLIVGTASIYTSASIRAETFEVSDHPTSMQILELINMYNENNPNSPIVCSSGFVFPQESHHSSSSTTSIINQVGQAIHEAVDGVHVPTGNNHHGNQETADMAKRTSTPVVDSGNNGGSDDSGNSAGSDDNSDDNGDGGESSDSGGSDSSDSSDSSDK